MHNIWYCLWFKTKLYSYVVTLLHYNNYVILFIFKEHLVSNFTYFEHQLQNVCRVHSVFKNGESEAIDDENFLFSTSSLLFLILFFFLLPFFINSEFLQGIYLKFRESRASGLYSRVFNGPISKEEQVISFLMAE